MAGRDGRVFKSASTGVLRPMKAGNAPDYHDPLQAVLQRTWDKEKPAQSQKEQVDQDERKKAPRGQGTAPDRSRLGQTGTALAADKNRLGYGIGDHSALGLSPPMSPDYPNPGRRATAKAAAASAPVAATRRYNFEVCPTEGCSPRLRSPPANRKGQVKLSFEYEAQQMDAEHGQSEVDDHMPHLDAEQAHFIDLCHKLEPLVDQAAVRLINMVTAIRAHFLVEPSWLEAKLNYDQLAELAFEVQTTNYFIAKWHHKLEASKVPAPTRPSKEEDMPAEDILAQALTSVSRMEVLASKFAPVLLKICHDVRTLRKGPSGEPLTPRSKNAITLAKKRGFDDVHGLGRLMGHLEHILAVALHLSNPPCSGLPESKERSSTKEAAKQIIANTICAIPAESAAANTINGAYNSIGASVNASAAAGSEG